MLATSHNQTAAPREFALEVVVAAASVHEDPYDFPALARLLDVLIAAAESGEAYTAMSALASEFEPPQRWAILRHANERAGARYGTTRPQLGQLPDVHLPALAAAACTWTLRHEFPVEVEPDSGWSCYQRVVQIVNWGAHAVDDPAVLYDGLASTPNPCHTALLLRLATLEGGEAALAYAEKHRERLHDWALSALADRLG